MTIHHSHFGCIKSAVLTGLRQMYIDGPCPSLGIDIKISGVSVGSSVIDPNKAFCIMRCTFSLRHIIPRVRKKLERSTKKSFYVFSFDDTEEIVVVRLKGEKGQDAIYEIKLCKYLYPENGSCVLFIKCEGFERIIKSYKMKSV